jgi:cytoskeleton protein RodZ
MREVASFGEQLRQAREAQNITLQEIAASTKISSRALQALESEQFEQLPGGIFNKGFVRAYARYVGLDEEKMLAAYMAVAKPDSSENEMETISSQLAAAHPQPESRVSGATLMSILALIVALGLGAVWLKEHRKEVRELAPAPAAQAPIATAPVTPAASGAGSATPAAAPSGTQMNAQTSSGEAAAPATANTATAASAMQSTAQQPAPESAAAGGQAAPVEVSISATKRSWISVSSDGKKVETVTLDPDKPELRSRNYQANEKLVLLTGNAAGLEVSYNGKPAGVLGSAGQRETVTFTPQGMEKQ